MPFLFYIKEQLASYNLVRSAISVDEGTQFTVTLTTTGVTPGTPVPYTITGVTSADLSGTGLTGVFTPQGTFNFAMSTITFTVAADLLTEGTETVVLSLDNGQASTAITVNDTSIVTDPFFAQTVFDFKFNGSYASSVGESLTLTPLGGASLTTTNPIEGTGSLSTDGNRASYATATRSTTYSYRSPWTFEASVRLRTFNGSFAPLALNRTGFTGELYPFQVYNNIFYVGDGNTINSIAVSGRTWTTNTVYHFATSFDGTTTRAYVNGQLIGSSTTLLGDFTWNKVDVGARFAPGIGTDGLIDRVRFTSAARYTGSSYSVILS